MDFIPDDVCYNFLPFPILIIPGFFYNYRIIYPVANQYYTSILNSLIPYYWSYYIKRYKFSKFEDPVSLDFIFVSLQ